MDKIKTVKIKNIDGSVSEESYSFSTDAKNVDMNNGLDLQTTMDNLENTIKTLKKKPYHYSTIADMKADTNLKNGDAAIVLGYYNIGDSAGYMVYRIITNNNNFVDDGGKFHRLNNGLFAKLVVDQFVWPEWFGAKGDGTTDDYVALYNCLNSGYKEIHFMRKNYLTRQKIEINNMNGLVIYGNNGIIKNIEPTPTEEADYGHGTLILNNCRYVTIKDLIVNANRTWMDGTYTYKSRPLIGDGGYSTYVAELHKQQNSFSFRDSYSIILENCKAQNCRIGYSFVGCHDIQVMNCSTVNTWADGIAFSTGCTRCYVSGHYCEMVNDDQYSAWGYGEGTGASYIYFDNCHSHNCWGALACFEGAHHCWITNSTSDNCNYTPLKGGAMSNSAHPLGTDHHYENCYIKMAERVQPLSGTTNLQMNIRNGENENKPSLYYKNVTIDATAMLTLYPIDWDRCNELLIENCTFINFKPYIHDCNSVKIVNSSFAVRGSERFVLNGNANVHLANNTITSKSYTGPSLVAIGQDGQSVNQLIDYNNLYEQGNGISHLINYAYVTSVLTTDPNFSIEYWDRVTKLTPLNCIYKVSSTNKSKIATGSLVYNTTTGAVETV